MVLFLTVCVDGDMLASRIRQDEDGASTQCVFLLRFGPSLAADAPPATLRAVGVPRPAYQHLAVEEHLLQTQES